MAEGGASKNLSIEKNVSCPVCLDLYSEPQQLQCLHSFCKRCVDTLVKNRQVTCPQCRVVTPYIMLKLDFKIQTFVEWYEKEQQKEVSASTDPESLSLDKANDCTTPEQCELCEELLAALYCHNCKKIMCKTCNRTHTKLSTCSGEHTESLKSASTRQMNVLEQEVSALAERVEEFESKLQTIISVFRQRQNDSKMALENAKEQLLTIVDGYFSNLQVKVDERTTEFEMEAQTLHDKYMDNVTSCQKAFDDLRISKPSEVAKKGEEIEKELKKNSDSLKFAEFKDMKIVFNQADVSSVVNQCTEALQMLGVTTLEPVEYTRLASVLNKKFQLQKKVSLPNPCCQLLLVKDRLWCFCRDNICVLTGERLESKSSIGSRCYGAAMAGDTEILLAAGEKGLLAFNMDTNKMAQVKTGTVYSVCAYREEYFAVREEDKKVYLDTFVKQNGQFVQTASVRNKVKTVAACPETIAMIREHIFVCSSAENAVYQLSRAGHENNRWKQTGSMSPESLAHSFICDADSSGCLLIADQNNHRLLVLQPENKDQPWSVVDIGGKIKYPRTAVVTKEGKLYVAGQDPNKLYIFTLRK